MDKEVKIIPVREEHLEACADIAVKAWTPIRAAFRERLGDEIYEAHFTNWQEAKRKGVKEGLMKHNGHVAVVDDKVVGFIFYHVNHAVKSGEIGGNAVDPEVRGLGIGGKMYNFVMDKMREEGMIYATVTTGLDDGHAPARRAYEKAGFEKNLPSLTYYKKL